MVTAVELISRYISEPPKGDQQHTNLPWYTALLLNFPAIFLTPPMIRNDRNHYKTNSVLKETLTNFINYGRLPELSNRAPHISPLARRKVMRTPKQKTNMIPLSEKQCRLIEKAVMAGNVGKAARSFDPQPMADVTQDRVKEQLQRLHPVSQNTNPFEDITLPSLNEANISNGDVEEAIKHLPKGRAMGPAKLSYETIKYLSKNCDHFNAAIAKLARLLSVGKFPHETMLKEAELIAIEKAEGSYRPIAMGNSIPKLLTMLVLKVRNREYQLNKGIEETRLKVTRYLDENPKNTDIDMEDVSKADEQISSPRTGAENQSTTDDRSVHQQQQSSEKPKYILEQTTIRKSYLGLSKEQLGVNTPCGVEAPGFIATELYKQQKLTKFFTIDISNAFNTVNRKQMAIEVSLRRPDLLPLVQQLYNSPTELELIDGTTISSQEGVRQGDPLSSFLYALVTDRILQKELEIAKQYNCRVFAYLDDHSFLLDKNSDQSLTVEKVIQEIKPDLEELSLKVNEKKCYTYIPEYILDEDILKYEKGKNSEQLRRDGCKFLGSPIGNETYVQKYIDSKLEKANEIFRHLCSVRRQAGYQVIRLSVAAEAMHLYRSLGDKLERFKQWDEKLFNALLQLSGRRAEHRYTCNQRRNFDATDGAILQQQSNQTQDIMEIETDGNKDNATSNVEKEQNSKKQTSNNKQNKRSELTLPELTRAESEFKRAKLMASLKQSNGGLGIALPRLTATPAHLGYILDCLKLIRERDLDVPLSKDTIDFVNNNKDLINEAGILIPDNWDTPGTKFYISKGSIQHPLSAVVQEQTLEGIQHRLAGATDEETLAEEENYSSFSKQILNEVGTLKEGSKMNKDRAFCLERDNQGNGAALSLSMSAYKNYFSFTNRVMAEILATKMLIPNRYGLSVCINHKQHDKPIQAHAAEQLNHAYACSNNGYRTKMHTRIMMRLRRILERLGHKTKWEPLITHSKDKHYGDLYVDSLDCIIDVSGVCTSTNDLSIEEAMRKRHQEKGRIYCQLGADGKLKRKYQNTRIIPFIYGPQGQIDISTERAFFASLGALYSNPSSNESGEGTGIHSDNYYNTTISKEALRDLKFEWKQLKKYIVQYTMENAIHWRDIQAKKQKINTRKYHCLYSTDSSESEQQQSSDSMSVTSSVSSTATVKCNQSTNKKVGQEF